MAEALPAPVLAPPQPKPPSKPLCKRYAAVSAAAAANRAFFFPELYRDQAPPMLQHQPPEGAVDAGGAPRPLPTCVSPNCADALELRGRWDAEVAARQLVAAGAAAVPAVSEALRAYEASTRQVLDKLATVAPDARVSSMNAPPRISRYQAMAKVHAAIAPHVVAHTHRAQYRLAAFAAHRGSACTLI